MYASEKLTADLKDVEKETGTLGTFLMRVPDNDDGDDCHAQSGEG